MIRSHAVTFPAARVGSRWRSMPYVEGGWARTLARASRRRRQRARTCAIVMVDSEGEPLRPPDKSRHRLQNWALLSGGGPERDQPAHRDSCATSEVRQAWPWCLVNVRACTHTHVAHIRKRSARPAEGGLDTHCQIRALPGKMDLEDPRVERHQRLRYAHGGSANRSGRGHRILGKRPCDDSSQQGVHQRRDARASPRAGQKDMGIPR